MEKEIQISVVEVELEKIRLKNSGVITPEAVVSAAKKPTNPLHDYFQWNDSAAAKDWRIEQARRLIRSVQVITTTSTRTFNVPKYVRDPRQGQEQGYAALVEIRDEADVAAEALGYECVRAAALLTRARDIAEVLGLSEQVDVLIGGVGRLKVAVESKTKRRRKAS